VADKDCFAATCGVCKHEFCWVCGTQHDVTAEAICQKMRPAATAKRTWLQNLKLWIISFFLIPIFGIGLAFAFVGKWVRLVYYFVLGTHGNGVVNWMGIILVSAILAFNFIPILIIFLHVWVFSDLYLLWL